MILINGVIDDLHQKNVRFSKLKLFYSMYYIRLSTVYSKACKYCNNIHSNGGCVYGRSCNTLSSTYSKVKLASKFII